MNFSSPGLTTYKPEEVITQLNIAIKSAGPILFPVQGHAFMGSCSAWSPLILFGCIGTGAWRTVEADSGCINLTIRLHSLFYSFRSQNQIILFCLKKLPSWDVYFGQSPGPVHSRLLLIIVKNTEKQLQGLFKKWNNNLPDENQNKITQNPVETSFCSASKVQYKKKTLLPEKKTNNMY